MGCRPGFTRIEEATQNRPGPAFLPPGDAVNLTGETNACGGVVARGAEEVLSAFVKIVAALGDSGSSIFICLKFT
jgi:hypothetical protein